MPVESWWRRVLLVAAGLVLATALVGGAYLLIRPVALLVAAAVLAAAMAGPSAWLARRLPPIPAVLAAYGLLVAAAVALGWFLTERLVVGHDGLMAIFPTALERAQGLVADWDPALADQARRTADAALGGLAEEMVEAPLALATSAAEVLVVLVMSVYWRIASGDMLRFVLSLFPAARRPRVAAVLGEIGETTGGYVRANVVDALIVGAIVYVGLLLIGVRFPLALALVAAIGEAVPLVGPYVAAVPILAAAVMSGPFAAGATLVLLVAVKQFEAYLLLPHLTSQQADVPPLLALFALVAGASVGGLLGALIAVPVAGVLRVLVLRVVVPAVQRRVGADPVEPTPGTPLPA
jgi:predicted PurR-regulated permease PerM